ncbi:PH domain-containing protein [Kribbella sp. NPDC055071]
MKSKPSDSEQYLSTSNRITGGLVVAVGVLALLDIVLEWRTGSGLLVACIVGILMVLAWAGLMRPSVTLSPQHLLLRNHFRDRLIPWNQVSGVDVTDILRVHVGDNKLRAPGVVLVMRDLRKQRVGGAKLGKDSSVSRADFVVDRIEVHMNQYGDQPGGELVTTWAKPELIVIGVLAVVGVVAALVR